MATTTNYSWTTPDDTALVKDGAAAIRTLGSSADTTVKALNPGTTAGDIDYYTTSTAKARIGIGTAGQVLQVNSGATAPEWATPASGGMTLLSTTTLSTATTTISGISGSYTDLQIVGRGIDLSAADDLYIRLNTNTGANYTWQHFKLTGTSVSGALGTGSSTSLFLGSAGGSAGYNEEGVFVMHIPRYSFAELHQIYSQNRCYAVSFLNYIMSGVFNSAAAITSITIFTAGGATFDAGTVYVYGVK